MSSLAELAGLSADDLDVLRRVGERAFAARNHALAVRVFSGLERLQPSAAHSLARAEAELASGNADGAVATLTRYLEREPSPDADTIRALRLRAKLTATTNPRMARLDEDAAMMLERQS